MAKSFSHLHLHTEYSMLDGAARISEVVAAAARDGQPAVGITDHGNMYGVLDFYKACKEHDVVPVIGTEAYMAYEHRSERPKRRSNKMDDGGGDDEGRKLYYHLTMLAENNAGYHNMMQLSSQAYLTGYYMKPRLDWELLEEYSEGLIVTTGCLGGVVCQDLIRGDFDGALAKAARLQEIFGRDNMFVELQDHGIPEQHRTMGDLLEIARRINAPLLATNDAHYTCQDDAPAHDALLCQPPGTMVRRVTSPDRIGALCEYEEVPIETLRAGDRVQTWDGRTRRGKVSKRGRRITEVGVRHHDGPIITVKTANGRVSSYTPEHIAIARLDGELHGGSHILYLMRKGNNFRIGTTTQRRTWNNQPLGHIVRCKEQEADAIWILDVLPDRETALAEEAAASHRYRIPTRQFKPTRNEATDLQEFWSRIGPQEQEAAQCLEAYGRDIRFPLWESHMHGGSRPQEIRAANLMSGMQVCEPDECTDSELRTYHGSGAWNEITVERSHYSGPVYSLDVEEHHTYVADGIVTHNCVQTGSLMSDENRFKFHGEDHYVKSAAEMRHLFRELPEACDNTLWVAERCKVEIEFGNPQLPEFPRPPQFPDADSYLRHITYEGAHKRWGNPLPAEIEKRVDYELGVISSMGFSDYFLITWDLIRHARESGIRVGPGRGSAAGCAVAYCLWITDLDPIKYDLLFERFLNPSRVSMPDIDMDYDSRFREEMIRYTRDTYGSDRVAQIVTFSTIKARAAVRDAARVLGKPYAVGDKIAKAMPPIMMGRDTPLHACLVKKEKYEEGFAMATELRRMYDEDTEAKEVIDVAKGLEGLRRSDGIHAAAVVITKEPLTTYLPVQRKPEAGQNPEDAPLVTQYEMHGVEELGLLKMDFLGLKNLDMIERALDLIERRTGQRPDIDNVDLEDEATYELLRRGDTVGVFQLESTPMRNLIRSLAPTEFDDVCALVALYRPGPMAANMHNDYADRKNGRKQIEYLHPDLEESLGATQGLMIYQESMMRVAQKFAGYSLAEADNLRKAAGKKNREIMARERAKFEEGCESTGYGRVIGKQLFDIIEPFADYAFNKSHSFGYGFIAYQTAWLKANYPSEYMAALLTTVKDSKDDTAKYLSECRTMGLRVLVPNVNVSESEFTTTDDGAIPFGLSAIRNVGEGVVDLIIRERDAHGPFDDFYDFCERVDPQALNKKTVESLIKAGAFDALRHTRRGLHGVFETAVEQIVARRREKDAGVMSLFDSLGGDDGPLFDDSRPPIGEDEWDKADRLKYEKEMLGLYVSDHPLLGAERALRNFTDCAVSDIKEMDDGQIVVVGGVVTSLQRKPTKKGDIMGIFVLEDMDASIEATAFPRVFAQYDGVLVDDSIRVVKARVDKRDDEPKLMVMEVIDPQIAVTDVPALEVTVPSDYLTHDVLEAVKELIRSYPGESRVMLRYDDTVWRLPETYKADPSGRLTNELQILLGPGCV